MPNWLRFSKRSAPQEIMAFGDGGNDLEKLAYVEWAMNEKRI